MGGGGYTSVFNFSMKMGSASGPHGNLPPWIGTLSIHQFFNKDEEGGGVRGGGGGGCGGGTHASIRFLNQDTQGIRLFT